MKYEVPSGDLQIVKHEIPSGDLLQLGIPSGDSFYSNEIWGPIWRPPNSEIRDPFWRSPLFNLESHLAIPLPITKYKNTYVVSLWRVTCPNRKRKEWSHYYGWPTQGEEWPHYYGWPTQVKKDEEWSHCMGDLPRKNDGLIVWVTNPRKMMVSLYGWRTQEKWWSHCMGDEPKKNDGLIVWVTNPRKIMVSLYGWRTQEKWWSHCMGDEPKKNDGLIVWVTNPRKMMVSLYGWRTQEK